MTGGTHEAPKKCGVTQMTIFLIAIATGSACSICSKTMMELKGVGITGDTEPFGKPIFQTFGMFVGMLFGLVMHWAVLALRIPFPGYEHCDDGGGASRAGGNAESDTNGARTHDKKVSFGANKNGYGSIEEGKESNALLSRTNQGDDDGPPPSLPVWMYFFLAIPSIFDLGATVLCMMGLQYLDVSIYQLLRGSGIIFVALMKQHVLKDKLYNFQWLGVVYNVVSVFLVGATAILNEGNTDIDTEFDEDDDSGGKTTSRALLGVLLVMAGAAVQAMQLVFEEKVMTMDIPAPPLLLIGMEGFWGTFLCLAVVYPAAYYIPGDDHGSYEDPFNTWFMFVNSTSIQISFGIYFFVIFAYNLFAVLVTFSLSSIWHAILDNFRPITIWAVDLVIYYVIAVGGDFGEPWTRWSALQVAGMCVLLYGTAVYNAPNSGSILLKGDWYALGIDLSREYDKIEAEEREQEMDAAFQERMLKHRKGSSFFSERSPHVSVHTQALHGLASPKM